MVDDGQGVRIRAHLARTDGVVGRGGQVTHEARPVLLRVRLLVPTPAQYLPTRLLSARVSTGTDTDSYDKGLEHAHSGRCQDNPYHVNQESGPSTKWS